jgi:16S rRNA C1402 (ribose-2'-O) methylase RsmI
VGREMKGEVVVVVEGAGERDQLEGDPEEAARLAATFVTEGARKREAARRAAAETGVSARWI